MGARGERKGAVLLGLAYLFLWWDPTSFSSTAPLLATFAELKTGERKDVNLYFQVERIKLCAVLAESYRAPEDNLEVRVDFKVVLNTTPMCHLVCGTERLSSQPESFAEHK